MSPAIIASSRSRTAGGSKHQVKLSIEKPQLPRRDDLERGTSWDDAENVTNRTVKAPPKNGTKRGTRRHWPAAIGTTWHKNDHYILVVGGRSLTSVKGISRTKPAAMSRLVVLPR